MNPVATNIFKWCMLAYLAILPVAETIALRNLLLFVLLLLLLTWWMRQGRHQVGGAGLWRWLPRSLLAWVVFLLVFPLWAVDSGIAWFNLRGQWGESLMAWALGLGAVLILGRRGPSLWALGLASAFLVWLHLLMTMLAWVGLFGSPAPSDLPVAQMWRSAFETLSGRGDATSAWQRFPWGFRGFDPMHGNLGYTASQAIALFLTCLVMLFWQGRWRLQGVAALAIALCFASIVIANSRGAVLYSLFLLMFGGGIYVYLVRVLRTAAVGAVHGPARAKSWSVWGSLVLLLLALFFFLGQTLSKDARWHGMVDRVRAGFFLQDPVEFLCKGLSVEARDALRHRISPNRPAYADEIIAGLNGDGGRVVLMRVGLELVLDHPRGVDGSRQSYEKLIEQRCGQPPVFAFAHAHQAWINLALALGWAGALLFAGLLLYFTSSGVRGLRHESERYWALALLLLSVFWILRGLTDAVYQEHYLQMQGLVLGYLWGRMKLAGQDTVI